MKLFSSQGCNSDNDSSDACNTLREVTDSAIIPDSLMDGKLVLKHFLIDLSV